MKVFKIVLVVAATAIVENALAASASTKAPPTYMIVGTHTNAKCSSVNMLAVSVVTAPATCKAAACSSGTTVRCSSDWKSAIATSVGAKPFLTAASYSDKACSVLSRVSAIPVDGSCHVAGQTSVKAVSNSDHSVSLTYFADSACAKMSDAMNVTSDIADTCFDGTMLSATNIVLPRGKSTTKAPTVPPKPTQPTYMVVGKHSDAKCSTINMITVDPVTPDSPCVPSNCSSRMTTKCTSDWKDAVAKSFGSKPYLVGATYSDKNCTTLDTVGVVPVDGVCHAMEETSSIKAVVNGDKTVNMMYYSDLRCSKVTDTVAVNSDMAGKCRESAIITVENLALGKGKTTPAPTAVKKPTFAITGMYSTGACSGTPAALMITPTWTSECSTATCYSKTTITCAEDYNKYVTTTFSKNPFVSIITFKEDKCTTVNGGSVVALDGSCIDLHGMYAKASQNADKSVSVKYFKDTNCSVADQAALVVTTDNSGKCSAGKVVTAVNVSLKK